LKLAQFARIHHATEAGEGAIADFADQIAVEPTTSLNMIAASARVGLAARVSDPIQSSPRSSERLEYYL
jgi:hypothetical protein